MCRPASPPRERKINNKTGPTDSTAARALISANLLKASAFMFVAVMCFVFMALAIRELSHTISVQQILFLRMGVGLPLLVGGVWAFRGTAGFKQFHTSNLKLHALRNVFQMCGQAAWIFAITVLTFATVFAIEYSTPLWAVLFGSLILREHPSLWQKWGLLIGFIGVLIILRPGTEAFSWGALVMLAGSMCFGGHFMTARVLARTDASLANPFWTCAMQVPITFFIALTDWRDFGWAQAPAILVLAASGLIAQNCVAASLKLAPLARVVPIDYLRLPIIAVIGALFYAEAIDPVAMVGAVIVIGAVLLTQKRQ